MDKHHQKSKADCNRCVDDYARLSRAHGLSDSLRNRETSN